MWTEGQVSVQLWADIHDHLNTVLYVLQIVTTSIFFAHTIQRNWLAGNYILKARDKIREWEQHCLTIKSEMQGWWQIPGSNCTYGPICNHKHTHPHGKTKHINCTEYARLYESTWQRWEMNVRDPSHQPWGTVEDESSASLSSLTADESQASFLLCDSKRSNPSFHSLWQETIIWLPSSLDDNSVSDWSVCPLQLLPWHLLTAFLTSYSLIFSSIMHCMWIFLLITTFLENTQHFNKQIFHWPKYLSKQRPTYILHINEQWPI